MEEYEVDGWVFRDDIARYHTDTFSIVVKIKCTISEWLGCEYEGKIISTRGDISREHAEVLLDKLLWSEDKYTRYFPLFRSCSWCGKKFKADESGEHGVCGELCKLEKERFTLELEEAELEAFDEDTMLSVKLPDVLFVCSLVDGTGKPDIILYYMDEKMEANRNNGADGWRELKPKEKTIIVKDIKWYCLGFPDDSTTRNRMIGMFKKFIHVSDELVNRDNEGKATGREELEKMSIDELIEKAILESREGSEELAWMKKVHIAIINDRIDSLKELAKEFNWIDNKIADSFFIALVNKLSKDDNFSIADIL